MTADHLAPLPAVALLLPIALVAAYTTAVLDGVIGGIVAGVGPRWRAALLAPLSGSTRELRRAPATTERPDATLWLVSPAAYLALVVAVLAVVPWSADLAVADVRTGIVVVGAAEVLVMVAVFLHGWSANATFALIGGYRFVALGLSLMLVSMFVLIAAALPARSLALGEIVASQAPLWNVIRQPLGLPLFLVVGLGVAFWGPLDVADSTDLARGTAGEVAGPRRVVWGLARRAMLAAYAILTATVFLGGHLGPSPVPGPMWLAAKSVVVLLVLVALGHLVGRIRIERAVRVAWTVLLPASFLHLALAGVEALT